MPAARLAWALRQPPWRLLAAFTALHAAAVALFSRGFLLTRVELTQRSRCDDAGCLGASCPSHAPDNLQRQPTLAELEVVQPAECPQKPSTHDGETKPSPFTEPRDSGAVNIEREHAQRPDHPGQTGSEANVAGNLCCGPPHFSKTLWLIVDALRFDFVLHESAAAADGGYDGNVSSRAAPAPPSKPPPPPPHVQRMPELLSLSRDWVRGRMLPPT